MKAMIFGRFITCCASVVFSCASLAGGDTVGNGGGLVEILFAFAKPQVENTISLCLRSPDCGTDLISARLQKLESILKNAGPDFPPLAFAVVDSNKNAIAPPPLGSTIVINLGTVLHPQPEMADLQLDGAIEILVLAMLNQLEPNQAFVNAVAASAVRRQVPKELFP